MDMLDWTLIRSLLAVVDHGSLTAAARATGQSQPTLGRHVAEAEAALGLSLFARVPRGLIPTEAMQAAIHAGDDPSGRLRLVLELLCSTGLRLAELVTTTR